jgi:hypothetical protein
MIAPGVDNNQFKIMALKTILLPAIKFSDLTSEGIFVPGSTEWHPEPVF